MSTRGRVLSQLTRFALEKISLGYRKFALLETTSVTDSLNVLIVGVTLDSHKNRNILTLSAAIQKLTFANFQRL